MMLLFVLLFGFVVQATVVVQSVPSLVAPLQETSWSSPDQPRLLWVSLVFSARYSDFWTAADCPPGVTCVSAAGDAVVRLGDSGARTKLPVGSLPGRLRYFRDVAGVLAVGPRSYFLSQKMLTMRQRGEEVTVEVSEAAPVTGSPFRVAIDPSNDRWETRGRLAVGGWWRKKGLWETVWFSPQSEDHILHTDWYELFDWARGARDRSGVLDHHNRLHRPCPESPQSGSVVYLLSVSGKDANFDLPVVWVKGPTLHERGMDFCPLSLLFRPNSPVTVGRALLARYDVGFDAGNQLVHLMPRSASFVAEPVIAGFQPHEYLQTATWTERARVLTVHFEAVSHPPEAALRLVDMSEQFVEFELLQESNPFLADVNLMRLAEPTFTRTESGPLYLTGRRGGDDRFRIHIWRSGHRVRVLVRDIAHDEQPNRRTPKRLSVSKDCAICLESLSPEETSVVWPCEHSFHHDCITDWIRVKKTCPVCRAEASV